MSLVKQHFVNDSILTFPPAVVHKERPDEGVFILQVGEGIVENSSDSFRGGAVGLVRRIAGGPGCPVCCSECGSASLSQNTS